MKKAFTLIELILALILITIIVLAMIYIFNPRRTKSGITYNNSKTQNLNV